jgi:hypothetical protein
MAAVTREDGCAGTEHPYGLDAGAWSPSANTVAGDRFGTSDLDTQRKAFAELTEPMFALVKARPTATPIYLDHCPMYEGGADWLSRDKAIRNPFYGAQMMNCGSVKETIAK